MIFEFLKFIPIRLYNCIAVGVAENISCRMLHQMQYQALKPVNVATQPVTNNHICYIVPASIAKAETQAGC